MTARSHKRPDAGAPLDVKRGNPPAAARVIDFHAHAFPDSLAEEALRKLSGSSGLSPSTDGTVAALLRSMDAAGIARSVVHAVATSPRQAASIRAWCSSIRSARIIPFPSVHPDSSTLLEEVRAIHRDGFPGIKLHPEYQGFAIDEERLDDFYGLCSDLGLILMFHAGDDLSFPASVRATPSKLARLSERFPALRLVAAHGGGLRRWPEVRECLLGRDIYLEFSFTKGYLDRSSLLDLLQRHRTDRILFGSDSPWDDQISVLSYFSDLDLPADRAARFFFANAEALLEP